MPRQARLVWPGKLHHVTQRGNYRQNIFYEDQDRIIYLKYIDENAKKYGVKIYAFCLMDNHVHFIVKPDENDSLARAFRVTHQKYSLYINKRLNEYGHRWQSRYYSCVLMGSHIAKAIRYVENNPVRARMVEMPWNYPWSSARAHLGKEYKIITLANIREHIATASWKKYLTIGEDEGELKYLRQSTLQGKVFGKQESIQNLQQHFKQKLLPQARGRPNQQ